MVKAKTLLPVLGLALLVGVGCAAATPEAAPTAEEVVASPDTPTPEPAPTEQEEPAVEGPAPAGEELASEEAPPVDAVSRPPDAPGEPAPVDGDFRHDPPTLVAATGRPQVLEFFTTW
jgi:hypothetical protein